MAAHRQTPVQHDVAIEQCAHRIHQRILLIVAFHQHGIESGDAALREMPGPLDQPRQQW